MLQITKQMWSDNNGEYQGKTSPNEGNTLQSWLYQQYPPILIGEMAQKRLLGLLPILYVNLFLGAGYRKSWSRLFLNSIVKTKVHDEIEKTTYTSFYLDQPGFPRISIWK